MAYKDTHGNLALPTLEDGRVPVSDDADNSVFEQMLLELRAIRIGLELQLGIDRDDLIEKAR
jgi:hypothetical protein